MAYAPIVEKDGHYLIVPLANRAKPNNGFLNL